MAFPESARCSSCGPVGGDLGRSWRLYTFTDALSRAGFLGTVFLQGARDLLGFIGALGDRVKIDFDFGLGLDGLVVEVGGFVAPFPDCSGGIREKGERSVERLHVCDIAVFIDRGFKRDRAGGKGRLRDLGIDARGEFAERDFFVAPPQPSFARNPFTRKSNRTLDVHCEGCRSNHSFAGQIHEGCGETSREISGRLHLDYAGFRHIHLDHCRAAGIGLGNNVRTSAGCCG
jgi:hypothetical protein